MSVEMRAYDNEHGDPVVVLVTTGTYDVSRLIGLMVERGRCEDRDRGHWLLRAVRRHNGGRAALKLLRDHGGTDFTEPGPPEIQWGLCNELGNVLLCTNEVAADEHLARYGPECVQVVRREVTPWTPRDPSQTFAVFDASEGKGVGD